MNNSLKNFWHSLNDREKVFVVTGGVIFALFLIYLMILKPLADKKHASAMALSQEKARYERIARLAGQANSVRQNNLNTPEIVMPIREAATITSRSSGVSISRIQPGPNETISFWVDTGVTRDVFNWLILLHEEYGKSVQKVSIQKNAGEETVRGQFEFLEISQ